MNPISVSPTLAMLNPAAYPAAQGSAFQDILDTSILAVGVATIAPTDGVVAADVSVTLPELQQMPATVQRAETQIGALADDGLQVQTAEIEVTVVGDVQPGASSEKQALEDTDKTAPALPLIVQTPPEIPVGIAVPSRAAVPPPAAQKADDVATATLAVDAPRTRPDARPRIQAAEPERLKPLPMLELGVINDSMPTRFGINAAPTATFTAEPSVPTPVADLRQLIVTQDREWITTLARDIVSNAARDNRLQFTLVPEHLGQLDVALTSDNGKIDVRLDASTAAAAQIISADQARLIEDLRQSGLKLGQFEMSNRQNGNGQQKAPTPAHQDAETISTPMQPKASPKALGRFA
jgi:hypothetical protein